MVNSLSDLYVKVHTNSSSAITLREHGVDCMLELQW